MIIWKGWGFLVAIIGFVCLLLAEFSTEAMFGDEQYYQEHGWPKLIGFLVAAAIVWLLGTYLNTSKSRTLIDKESAQEIIVKPGHSLFFIEMQYWGPIFVLLGLLFLFV